MRHTREVNLCQQTIEIQVITSIHRPWALGTHWGGGWHQLTGGAATQGAPPLSCAMPHRMFQRNFDTALHTGRWTRHIAVKDGLTGHSRKSLRQFLSSTSKAPTPPRPQPSWLCVLSAPDKEQIYLSIGSLLDNVAEGKRLCVDWGPGQGFRVTAETTFGGGRLVWFCHTS